MQYVYSINSIGLDIVFFANKRAALNYAKAHNIRKLSNGHWGIFRLSIENAICLRKEFAERKAEAERTADSLRSALK